MHPNQEAKTESATFDSQVVWQTWGRRSHCYLTAVTHMLRQTTHIAKAEGMSREVFFFPPLEGVFFLGLNTPTEQQRETWSEQPTRAKCEAELTEGKDIYPAVVSRFYVFGLAKMGRKLLFFLIFILCLSVTLQRKGRRRFCDIFFFFGNFVDATLFKSAGRRSCFWMLKLTTSTSYFSLLHVTVHVESDQPRTSFSL